MTPLSTHLEDRFPAHILCIQAVKALAGLPRCVGSRGQNISILHLSFWMSDLQFSLALQTHALVL